MKKTIFITGSTDGIGKLVAMRLGKDGHNIILHGRDKNKLKETINDIKKFSNNKNIDSYISDFTDLDSVKKIGTEISYKYKKIDVLINNAGIYNTDIDINKNKLDKRFVVNYLAPYILTNKLIDLLGKGDDARIINVSSAAQSSISYDMFWGKEKGTNRNIYAQSKLALLMWSFFMAKKYENILSIAVNPGSLLDTKMAIKAFGHSWSKAEKGSDILYDLAILDNYKKHNGTYYDNDIGSFGRAHPDAYDDDSIKKLIENTDKLIKDIM